MVQLEVTFECYCRGEGIERATITRPTLLEALKVIVTNLRLYFDIEDVEKENMSAQEILDRIYRSNGDGCDFIFKIKDLIDGKVYLEDGTGGEEEW